MDIFPPVRLTAATTDSPMGPSVMALIPWSAISLKAFARFGCFSIFPASTGRPPSKKARSSRSLFWTIFSKLSAMIPVCMGCTSKPSSARRRAGSATSANVMVPNLSRAANMPKICPGTPTALPPTVDHFSSLDCWEAYMSLVAEAGATSR